MKINHYEGNTTKKKYRILMIIFDVLIPVQKINNQDRVRKKTINIVRWIDPMTVSMRAFNDLRIKKKTKKYMSSISNKK